MIDDLAWYLAAGQAAHPIADWAIDQMLTYGPGVILCTALYTGWSIAERIHERLRDASHHIDELLAPITANNQPDIDELAARRNATGRRKEKL